MSSCHLPFVSSHTGMLSQPLSILTQLFLWPLPFVPPLHLFWLIWAHVTHYSPLSYPRRALDMPAELPGSLSDSPLLWYLVCYGWCLLPLFPFRHSTGHSLNHISQLLLSRCAACSWLWHCFLFFHTALVCLDLTIYSEFYVSQKSTASSPLYAIPSLHSNETLLEKKKRK